MTLSAFADKKIEFHDTIYASGTVNLNKDYKDAERVSHKQTGDIVFTGATTEADLLAVKEAHLLALYPNTDVSNLSVTEDEILKSRTSIVTAMTNLYGGRLRIEDGAVYQGAGLTVRDNSAATVLLKDGTMTHTGKDVSFASGTTLSAAGKANLTAGTLTMADGAAWSFEVSAANADKAVLTYSGDLTLSGKLSVNLTTNSTLTDGVSYQLLTGVAKPTNWTADNITVTTATPAWSVGFADLTWEDNTLWLNYNSRPDLTIATWTNESNDGLWNTSSVNWSQDEYDYAYQNGVQVVFGDKGAGTVTLVGPLAPENVLVNSSQNYSFEGAGKLTGSMNLTKQGEGTLDINTANDYTGGTLISGGKLVAGTATALGTGAVVLNGGTLEIGATGFANTISTYGTSTLKIADGITHQLNATLTNNGTLTLTGTVDATALATVIAETHIDAEGNSGHSGFLRLAGKDVDIMGGSGTLVNNGTVTINGTTVTLDADGYGRLEGAVQYGKYSIVDGTHSVEAILGKSATATIEMSAGTLTANAATNALSATGGTIHLNKNVELGGSISNAVINVSDGTLSATLNGANTLNAANWALGTALTNNGTLTLTGSVDASALATVIAETHVDAEGNTGNSGFLRLAGKEVDIMDGSGALVNNGSVTIGGTTVTLDAGGYGKLEGAVQYGLYSIVDGTHSVEAILGKSATASIEMSAGTLTANAATDKLTATGGVINLNKNVELGGSISNAVINVSDGTLSATLSGNNALNAANWALGTALTNNGTLTLTGTVDASALATVIAETHVDAEGNTGNSGFLRLAGKEVDIMDGSGALVNNGSVTIGGTTVTLDAGGYGKLEGAVQYGLYSIVDGTHSVDAILGKSATASIEMSAGTLTANAATDKLTATGGTINLNKNVELGGNISNAVINVSDGTLSATLSGNNTLNASNWAIGQALTNNGTLTLTGTVDASDLAVHVDEMLVNTQLQPSSSGFLKTAGSSVAIMDGSGTLDSTGATITVNGQTITLDEQGRGQLGQSINYGLYTINGTDSASVKEIMKAAKGEAETTDIVMNGGSLSFDADATGSLSLTGTASATVDVASTLSGNLVLNGGTLAMQGELLTIGGALDIQGATFLSLDGYATEGTYTLLTYGSFTGDLSLLQLQNLTSSTLKMTLLTSDDALMLVLGNKIDWTGGDITGGILEDMDITISDDRNVSADIIGDSSVTVNGGDVTLSGNNSYTGGTEINGGSLTAGSDRAFGTGDVTLNDGKLDLNDMDITNDIIANGGILDGATNYGGDLTVNGDLVVGDNTTANSITVNKGDITGGSLTNTEITYKGDSNTSADITGDSSVEVNGGDVTLSGNNSYTDGTEINGGSLTAGSDTAFGTGDVTLNDGKLDLNGMGVGNDILANGGTMDGATNYGGDLTVNGDLVVGDNTTANSITVNKGDITGGSLTNTDITYKGDSNTSADITGDSSVTVNGGDVTLSGNNSYTGDTEINGGSLTAGSDTAFGTGDVMLNDGSLDLNGAGVGNDIIAGGGTLDGATNYGGDLTVNGDLEVGDNTTANSITVNKGDITGGSLTNTGITYKGDSNTSADITGDSSVTVNGGDVTLSGNNSYTGGTEINGGSLTAGSDTAFGTGDVTLNDGVLDLNGMGITNDIIAGGGTLDGATNYGGDLTVNGDLVVGDNTTANSITVTQGDITGGSLTNTDITYKGDSNTSADITGDSSVTVNGGDVTLSGNNSYTGGTEINGGSLTAGSDTAFGTGDVTLNDGVLDLNGMGITNDIIAGGGTLDGATNYGGDLTVNGDLVVGDNTTANSITVTQGDITGGSLTNTDITYKGDSNTSADITGDSSVTVNGGDVTLSGNNSYTGGTELVNGSLTVMHPNALGAGALTSSGNSSLTVGNGLTLELDSMITNNGSLTVSGSIDASALATSTGEMLVDTNLKKSTSGFLKTAGTSVDIMDGSGTLDSTGATITVNGQTITLDEHGYGELGQRIDFSKYTINGTDSASVKAIMKAAKGEADTTDIVMNGGSLSIDADATGDVTLNGAAFASVDKNAKVAGDVVLNGGTLALQADKKLSISGTLDVKAATDLLLGGYGAEGLYKLLSFGSFAGDIALLNPMERMRASSKKTLLTTDDSLMLVTGDKLDWTGGNITSGKLDGLDITYTGDSNTSADITGDSSVTVNDGDVMLSGNNSYAGGTEINGGSLLAGHDTAFGTGDVTLHDGVLDLNNKKVTNNLAAHGGTIAGGSHYSGSLTLGGHVTLGGNLSAADATVQDGTKLTLNDHTLNVTGSLTMQGGMTLDLAGSSFGDGDTLITFGRFDGDVEDITLLSANGDYVLRVDGNALILELLEALQEPAVIDREACDTLVQANWGAFSASHAFTDAVHGQRTAAGYVAGGNATVWMSALGGQHTLDSSKGCAGANVELYGGAVGIEGQLDEDNRIGFALGHVRGEVKPEHGNFAKVDQDGTYAALYGAHTLVDEVYSHWVTLNWSMAYGDTESEVKTGGSKTSWNQDSIQLNARLDWVQAVTLNTSVSAFAGLEYYANNSDELADGTKSGSVQNLRGEIGVCVRHTMGSMAVYAELSYLNDMLRHNPTATVEGLRGQGANPGRHGIGISAGLQQNLGDGWSVNLNYSMEAMQHADEHRANIGIGKRF